MAWNRYWCCGIFLVGCLVGCHKPENPGSGSGSASPSASTRGPVKTVRLPVQVEADAKIRTAAATREVVVGSVDVPGDLSPDPNKVARIASPVAGRVEKVSFDEGTAVSKGSVLAVLRVPELGKVRSAYAATTAKAKAARAQADRQRSLFNEGLAIEQVALDAEAAAKALDAEATALREQLSAMDMTAGGSGAFLTLRAPFSGVVTARAAVVGQPVAADDVLGTITDLSEVWFIGRIYERDLPLVHLGARASVRLDAFPSDLFEGNVTHVGKQVDPATRTLLARIPLVNVKGLLGIGLFGGARVFAGDAKTKAASIVVLRTAITDLGDRRVVFVRKGPGEYEIRDVVLGDATHDRVEVRSGVTEGEPVVVEGGFTLRSVALKATFSEEE